MKTENKFGVLIALSYFCAVAFAQDIKPSQIFEMNSQSIVLILTFDGAGAPVMQGSGVVLSDNLVATNCHVVTKSTFIGIQLNEKRRFAGVAASYPERDLCLLNTDGPIGQAARLAENQPLPGDKAYTLGHPRGLGLTISEGLISGLRRTPKGEFIQTSAAISPGSSGGGLFDATGNLVGITTLSMSESQNINFATPIYNLAGEILKVAKSTSGAVTTDQGLTDSSITALTATNRSSPPVPEFADSEQRLSYLRWLGHQSTKLEKVIPSLDVRREFLQTIWYESRRAGIDVKLVLALVQTLSQYRKFHVSEIGARGYMQVLPKWSKILGDGDAGLALYLVEVAGVKSHISTLNATNRALLFTRAGIDN